MAGLAFTTLEAGVNHTCGLTADGTAYCWGENDKGQIGDGTVAALRPTPVPVATPTKFTSLAPGGSHTCGVAADGQAHCWGWNRRGQIGNGAIEAINAGTHGVVPRPARVRPPLF